MKLNLMIDIELPESDRIKMCSDMTAFFREHLTLTGSEDGVFSVLNAVPLKNGCER